MNTTIPILTKWLTDLYDDFGDESPSPQQAQKIIQLLASQFNSTPVKYLGSGDNGIAFLADDGDVIKLTIDKNEAILWNRLKNQQQIGIAQIKDVINFHSSKSGESIVYAVKVEYAPLSVTRPQAQLIKQIVDQARSLSQQQYRQRSKNTTKEQIWNSRTLNFIRLFQQAAKQYPEFSAVPELLMDLADKHQGHIYDLQPDNFRRKQDGQIVLIDPSVPDLIGDIQSPSKLMYEHLIQFLLQSKMIII
jgi:hypothetical protein